VRNHKPLPKRGEFGDDYQNFWDFFGIIRSSHKLKNTIVTERSKEARGNRDNRNKEKTRRGG
jgi:hypothetical protein